MYPSSAVQARVEAALARAEVEPDRRHPLRRVPLDLIAEAVVTEATRLALGDDLSEAVLDRLVALIAARN